MKPLKRTTIQWSASLSYCIGLIASDGSLSKDGRHLIMVSKDYDLLQTFKKCLDISAEIRPHGRGYTTDKRYFRLQFGDVNFYNFLLSIGLTPNKSKTIGALAVPKAYFADFLRGSFDGDGTFYSYFDKRWPSSYLIYLAFISASKNHLLWIQQNLATSLKINGSINRHSRSGVYQLRYSKRDSKMIISFMYYADGLPKLERKHQKIYNALVIDNKITKREC